MVRIVNDDIEIVYEWELFFEPMSRAMLLSAGLALIAGAAALALAERLQTGITAWSSEALYKGCAAVAVAGLLLGLRAVMAQRHRMSSVTIGDAGITFRWRPSGRLGRPGAVQTRFVAWRDMAHVEWTEEGQEHEFKQVLNVRLREPMMGQRQVFRLLICDTRSYRECHTLHAKMPAHAPRPASLREALKFS